MSKEEQVKEVIARELAGFLLLDDKLPENVDIAVRYPHSTARLSIGTEEIKRVLEGKDG